MTKKDDIHRNNNQQSSIHKNNNPQNENQQNYNQQKYNQQKYNQQKYNHQNDKERYQDEIQLNAEEQSHTDEEQIEHALELAGRKYEARAAAIADDERVMNAIARGLERGKSRLKPRSRWRIGLGTGAVLACIVLVLTISIRVSPVFADALRNIPGLAVFVELVEHDPMLKDVIDKKLIQKVDQTVEKDGIRLTVEGLIADEQRLVILYTSNATDPNTKVRFNFYDEQNESLEGVNSYGYSGIGKTMSESRGAQDLIDLQLVNGSVMPEQIRMEALIGETTLNLSFPIEHNRFEDSAREIELNQSYEIEGQKVTFVSVRVSPLQMALKVRYAPENSNQVTGFMGMTIKDERGKEWSWGSAYHLSEHEVSYHFNSQYFKRPKKLMLKADGIYLVPKGKKIIINTEEKVIITAPDSRLSLVDVTNKKDHQLLEFVIRDLDETDKKVMSFNLLSQVFTDGLGNTHKLAEVDNFTSGQVVSSRDSERMIFVPLPLGSFPQPLTFTVEDYPGYAEQKIELDFKL